jgi:hypothetical protein
MLFELPDELQGYIYSFDTTYKDYIQKVVLVEMMLVMKNKIFNHIENMGNDYSNVYNFLVSDSINPKLIAYDTKFHAIDQKFFNYHFMKRKWTEQRI